MNMPEVTPEQARAYLDSLTPEQKFRMSTWEIFHKLTEKIASGEIPVDGGGHLRGDINNKMFEDRIHLRMSITGGDFDESEDFDDKGQYNLEAAEKKVAQLAEILNDPSKPAMEKPLKFRASCLFRCYDCGQDIGFQTDGKTLSCANPCPYPQGHPPVVYEINVPSGKFVVGNDYRDKFVVIGDYDVNTLVGCAQTTKKYAEVGLAHGFVGNTCPGFWQGNKTKTKFYIGSGAYPDDGDEEPIARNAVRVGGICTDLWWYSVADYDQYIQRYGEIDKHGDDVVECKPGVYRFTHYLQVDRDDFKKPRIYCKIEWVRKPDPVVDLAKNYNDFNPTAGQVALAKIDRWPSLYKCHDDEDSFARVADTIFCSGSSCRDYHPNGYVCDDPDLTADAKDVEIPVFTRAHHWYPMSQWSFIVNASGEGEDLFGGRGSKPPEIYLNESFTALAFNVLHCIIKYGCLESSGRNDGPTNVALAKDSIVGLAKKYPDRVPEYCREILASLEKK